MCELIRRIGCDGARTATTLHVDVAMWVSGATSVTRSVGNPTSRYDEAPAVGQTCAEASFRARPLCHTKLIGETRTPARATSARS